MNTETVRVAINGYGVIGKRVADAVRLQPDMTLVGVADVTSDYRIKVLRRSDPPIFAATSESQEPMRNAGIRVKGSLDELLEASDIGADCTPKGVGAKNLERYQQAGVKAIYQGGRRARARCLSYCTRQPAARPIRGRPTIQASHTLMSIKSGSAVLSHGPVPTHRSPAQRRSGR